MFYNIGCHICNKATKQEVRNIDHVMIQFTCEECGHTIIEHKINRKDSLDIRMYKRLSNEVIKEIEEVLYGR